MSCSETETLTQTIIEFFEKMSSWEQAVAKEIGLGTTQVHALEILGSCGAMKMKELAERMGVTTGTLTVLVDKLEEKGLLRRVPHESDRRSYRIELTEEGNQACGRHFRLHDGLTHDLTASFSAEELDTLASLMGRMVESF